MRGNVELELRRIGDSLGVILPAEGIDALQVQEGGHLTLVANDKGYQLSAEFAAQMERARSLLTRYAKTLRELAK